MTASSVLVSSIFSLLSVLYVLLLPSSTFVTAAAPQTYAPFAQLSPSIGIDSTQSLHYPQLPASVFCPADSSGSPSSTCLPIDTSRTCLSRDLISHSFLPTSELFLSLYPRYDISLVIENQGQASSRVTNEIFRILASEVYGYSVRQIQNTVFHTQLPRCTQGAFDYHLQIWREDWTQQEYIDFLLGGAKKDGLLDTPATCSVAGSSGTGADAWFADTYTVTHASTERPRPLALGHYLAYQLPEAVIGLPRLNLTEALSDQTNIWFIPPLCRNASQICGVAYGYKVAFAMGVAQQQITNLKWLVALKLIPGITADQYAVLVRERVDAHQQVLFVYNLPDSLTANPDLYTHVSLPDPTSACYPQDRPAPTLDGVGLVACDFQVHNLMKIKKDNTNTDYTDSQSLFERYEISHEIMLNLLVQMDATATQSALSNGTIPALTEADIACLYLRNSTSLWSAWFQPATPRRFTVQLSMVTRSVLIAFLALYMLCTILCMYLIYLYRKHEVIRKSSYTFNQLIVFGSLFVYVSVIVAMQPDTSASCVLSQYAMSVGFCLFYGSLLVKTYRIDRLFTAAESLRSVSLPDKKLMMYLAGYAAVDLLIVLLWSSIDPPHPELVAHSTKTYADISVCSSQATPYFRAALLILRGIVLIVGAVFAVRIRDIEECYNESRYLALITYNILVVSAIVVLIPYASSNEPSIIIGSWFGGCTISVFGSLMTFILPKLHTIKVPQKMSRRQSMLATPQKPQSKQLATGNGTGVGGGTVDTNMNTNTNASLNNKGTSPGTLRRPSFPLHATPPKPEQRGSLSVSLRIPQAAPTAAVTAAGSTNTSVLGRGNQGDSVASPHQINLQVLSPSVNMREDSHSETNNPLEHSAPMTASIALPLQRRESV